MGRKPYLTRFGWPGAVGKMAKKDRGALLPAVKKAFRLYERGAGMPTTTGQEATVSPSYTILLADMRHLLPVSIYLSIISMKLPVVKIEYRVSLSAFDRVSQSLY